MPTLQANAFPAPNTTHLEALIGPHGPLKFGLQLATRPPGAIVTASRRVWLSRMSL